MEHRESSASHPEQTLGTLTATTHTSVVLGIMASTF